MDNDLISRFSILSRKKANIGKFEDFKQLVVRTLFDVVLQQIASKARRSEDFPNDFM